MFSCEIILSVCPDLPIVHSVEQAELLVIDEAAAIPLPLVKAMLGPYLVWLCSTVNGYEGTGRSLSLKLLQQLRSEVKLGKIGSRNKSYLCLVALFL